MTLSVGELMCGRKLRQEVQGGRPQFVPGQYGSKKYTSTDGVLSYIDPSGVLCIIPCELIEDEWMPKGVMFRVGVTSAEVRRMPPGSRLSDPGQRAMEVVPKKKQQRAASDQTT